MSLRRADLIRRGKGEGVFFFFFDIMHYYKKVQLSLWHALGNREYLNGKWNREIELTSLT